MSDTSTSESMNSTSLVWQRGIINNIDPHQNSYPILSDDMIPVFNQSMSEAMQIPDKETSVANQRNLIINTLGKTIDVLKENKCAFFDSISDKDIRDAQLRTVKYLTTLSNLSTTDISKWDIGLIFSDPTTGLLVTERQDINKRFFAFRDKQEITDINLSPDLLRKIEALEKLIPQTELNQIKESYRINMQRASERYSSYMNALRSARECKIRIDSFEGKGADLKGQVEQVIRVGFWELRSVDPACISFITKQPIVLTYKNTAQSIDITYEVGRICIVYYPQDGYCGVNISHSEGVRYFNGHIHPHVGGDGDICFGTAGDMATRAMAECNLVRLCAIVQQTLTEYNPDSPYVALQDFNVLDELGRDSLRDDDPEYLDFTGQEPQEEEEENF